MSLLEGMQATDRFEVFSGDFALALVVELVEGVSELGLVHGHAVLEAHDHLVHAHALRPIVRVLLQFNLSAIGMYMYQHRNRAQPT